MGKNNKASSCPAPEYYFNAQKGGANKSGKVITSPSVNSKSDSSLGKAGAPKDSHPKGENNPNFASGSPTVIPLRPSEEVLQNSEAQESSGSRENGNSSDQDFPYQSPTARYNRFAPITSFIPREDAEFMNNSFMTWYLGTHPLVYMANPLEENDSDEN